MRNFSLLKFLALLLMAVSSATMSMAQNVAKIGTTEYATLQEAIDAVQEDKYAIIKIINTAEFEGLNIADKRITIDLQKNTVKGNYINVTVSKGKSTFLKIQDTSKNKVLSVDENNNYSVTYKNSGILELTKSIKATNGAGIKVVSGTIVSTENVALFALGDFAGKDPINSYIEITGGYIKAESCCVSPQGLGATVTIDGKPVLESLNNAVVSGNGTYKDDKKLGGTSITIMGKSWLIGRIKNNDEAACGIYHPQQGTLMIKYHAGIPNIVAINGAGIVMRGGTLEYKAGNITAIGDANFTGTVGDSRVVVGTSGIVYDRDCGYYDVANAKITITSTGEKKVVGAKSAIQVINDSNNNIDGVFDITAGNFSSDVSAYVAKDSEYECNKHGEASYIVNNFSVKNGDVKYVDLRDAFSEAKDGDVISILKDREYKSYAPKVEGKSITLDLNGKNSSYMYLEVKAGGNLTIKDSGTGGTFNGTGANSTIYVNNGGVFNLESGTLTNSSTHPKTSNVVVRVEGGTATTRVASTANIKGGKIESKGTPVFVAYPGATVNVSGGELKGSGLACIAGNGTEGQGGTTINVSGGTLTAAAADEASAACGIYHPNEGTLTITGGTINVAGGVGVLMRSGEMTMTGGEIHALGDISKTGTVGDSRVVVTSSGIIFDRDANYPCVATTKINISENAKVNGAKQAIELINENKAAGAENVITVKGGTYSSDVTPFCEAGNVTVPDANGVYSIVAAKPLMMVYKNTYNEVTAGSSVNIDMDDISSIQLTENVAGVTTTLTKTFNNTGWNAFFVPFDFTLTAEMLEKFEFATLYGTLLEGGIGSPMISYIKAKVGDKINAYFPCMIKAKATGKQTINMGAVNYVYTAEIKPESCTSTKEVYNFYPVMANTYFAAKKGYYLNSEQNSFVYNVNAGAYIQPFKYYMTIQDKKTNSYIVPTSGGASQAKFCVIGEGEATGITDIVDDAANASGKVYNLQGVLVGNTTEGLPKGVYIKNGRKIIVK